MVNNAAEPFDKLAEKQKDEASAFSAGTKTQSSALGSSGTEVYAGNFSEEYLSELRGTQAAMVWDKMRRSESQVAMLLAAITNPIKAANWEIEPYDQTPEAVKHAELIKAILFEGIDFETFKNEALTMVAFGYSLFEVVHNVVFNHPKFGTFNGLAALGFRSQKTIETWTLEKKTGKLLSVEQWAQGDVGDHVKILGDFLLVFTNQKEGDNLEGISALRPMYGAYKRKQLYLKLTAIGVEKYAVGTPVGTVPANKENTKDFENFKNVLASYTSHEKAYITKPEGWEIEIQRSDFDASKIVELLKFENTEMVNCVVANFLALGTNGGGGAFALSNDLSDFFATGIQSYADVIAFGLTRKLIVDLCKLNFGQLPGYPRLRVSGISDKAGKELAEIVSTLANSKAVRPDMPLEEFLRRQYKMPKPDPKTSRAEEAPAPEPVRPTPAQVKLAEGASDNDYTKLIDESKAETKAFMQARLRAMGNDLKKKLKNKFSSASSDNAKVEAATKVEIDPKLIEDYKTDLVEILSKLAVKATRGAEAETDRAKKLSETGWTFAAPQGAGFYAALPDHIKKIVTTQAQLLADTQPADISKVVTFQYSSSETGTTDAATIEADLDAAIESAISGEKATGMSVDAAAGNVVARVASQAQMQHFFDPEVYDEIESFTFENNDPVSEICNELAGVTFAANDPRVDEFTPPLHHNCKSRLVANLKGDKNPEVDKSVEISDDAKKSMTLAEVYGGFKFGGPGSGGAREGAGRKSGSGSGGKTVSAETSSYGGKATFTSVEPKSKLVSVKSSGELKVKKPANAEEAEAALSDIRAIRAQAEKDYAAVKENPGDPNAVYRGLRLRHINGQEARAATALKKLRAAKN